MGLVLRRIGFFRETDFQVLSRIVIRITLPAAIITSFAGKEIDPALMTLSLLGLGGGLLYIGVACAINLHGSREQEAFEILNLSSYNIGNFMLPFVQSFLGPTGVIATSLFDTGNAVICLGGAYSLAAMVKDGRRFSLWRLLWTLLHSIPFDCYLIVLVLNLLRIPLPAPVLSCAEIIGGANAFLAMLMIGVGFKIESDLKQVGEILKILLLRYGIATVLALTYYFVLPFPLEVRQTLVILAFSPIGTSVPAFTGELHGDVSLSSEINSLSILCSIVILVILLPVLLT